MRTLQLSLLVTLPVVWCVVLYTMMPPLTRPSTGNSMSFSDWLSLVSTGANVMAMVVGLSGVFIGITSYRYAVSLGERQAAAAVEQGKHLTAQVATLDASRAALEQVLTVSQSSSKYLEAQLALLTKQREEELAKLARRPKLEIGVQDLKWEQVQSTVAAGKSLLISLDAGRNNYPLILTIHNVGDAPALKPVMLFSVDSPNVSVTPNQYGGPSVLDLFPESISGGGYRVPLDLVVQPGVQKFTLSVKWYADGLPSTELKLPIAVERKQ